MHFHYVAKPKNTRISRVGYCTAVDDLVELECQCFDRVLDYQDFIYEKHAIYVGSYDLHFVARTNTEKELLAMETIIDRVRVASKSIFGT